VRQTPCVITGVGVGKRGGETTTKKRTSKYTIEEPDMYAEGALAQSQKENNRHIA